MANFFFGEQSRRPGTYRCMVNGGKNNLFVAESAPVGGNNLVTVKLFVTDEVLHAKGPAFSMGADEAVIIKKITRPTVMGETLTIKSTRA